MARILARMWVEAVRCFCRSLPPAAFFEQGAHGIQEYLLPSPLDQTRTKVSEKGKIKAGIGEF
jgi:hypothetical protein